MEEMRKEINIKILVVTMLIITISSVVSTFLMYQLLLETRHDEKENASVTTNMLNK